MCTVHIGKFSQKYTKYSRRVFSGTLFFLIFVNMDSRSTISADKDLRYMKEALREAEKALKDGEVPVGAVVVCNDHIIGRGYNQVERLNDPTAHAELLAITAATHHLGNKLLEGCTLYVTVEPCPMCASALYWARPDRIVFATSDPKRGYRLFQPSLLHPRTQIMQGILEELAQSLLHSFFESLRKKL